MTNPRKKQVLQSRNGSNTSSHTNHTACEIYTGLQYKH